MSAAIRLSLALTVACAGLLLAGRAAAAPRKPARQAVTMEAVAFQPGDLTVHVGDTVVWTNKDLVPHTVTASAARVESGVLAPNKKWRFVAKKKGEMPYICSLHPVMKGLLVVK